VRTSALRRELRRLRALALAFLAGAAALPRVEADSHYKLITILHTNDLHGVVSPVDGEGGLARAATVIQSVREQMPNVVLIDGGDIIHGTYEDYLSQGRATIAAMNAVGYNAAAAGNHEFDYGLATAECAIRSASFPFLAANIRSTGGGRWNGLNPYAIIVVDDVRIAVFGLATLETVSLHWPGSIKGIEVTDPLEAARELVPKLRPESDVIVAISHLGYPHDLALASAVPGIDFIVGAHSHTSVGDWETVGETVITQAGCYGRSLGRLDFIVRKDDSPARVVSVNSSKSPWNKLRNPPLDKAYPDRPLIPITRETPEDQAVTAAYAPYRARTDEMLSEVIAEASPAIPAAKLVAKALREMACSDAAVVDAKSIDSAGLPSGPITMRNAFDLIHGFTRQEIIVARMSGVGLSAALARVARGVVSDGVQTDSAGRVVLVNDALLDETRDYTIAAQAYVMQKMLEVVPEAVVTAEMKETPREAVVALLRGLKAAN